MGPLLPIELIVEILVFAALDPSISNRQRIELSRVCKAGFIAVHRHALLPHIRLHSSRQVHALARTLSASRDIRQAVRSITSLLSISISSPAATASSPSLAFAFSASSSSSSDTLYGAVQRQIDVEQALITPIRTILSACSSLESLHMDLTPAALDYRLRKTTIVSKTNTLHRNSRETPVWTWSRAPISHQAHIERITSSDLTPFRSNLRELVCIQNVLGGGDFVDQLHTFSTSSDTSIPLTRTPKGTVGRWDRLESLQLLGPRFRLTCSSARTLGQALPSLKRLALVMANIMPPASNTAAEEGGAEDVEELGRDLFLRMSPLQLLIDTLCPPDAEPKSDAGRTFEHLLVVGHDLPGYVGGATKLESGGEDPSVQPPRVQLVSAKIKPFRRSEAEEEDEELNSSIHQQHPAPTEAHPMAIARWVLRRARTQTHWTFGPDHPSRASNVCLRPPVALNDVIGVEDTAEMAESGADVSGQGQEAGEEDIHDAELEMEMGLAEADEVLFCDDEKEGVEYSLESFELPITYLPPLSPPESASGGDTTNDTTSAPLQTSSSAFYLPSLAFDTGGNTPLGQAPSSHVELPHSYGPSRSGLRFESESVETEPRSTSQQDSDQPDLEYVDAALRSRSNLGVGMSGSSATAALPSRASGSHSVGPGTSSKQSNSALRIETIHPGRPEFNTTFAANTAASSSGAGPSFAASLASRLGSTWASVWGSGGNPA
ncbi:hypothetical protein OC846_002662 [Tilletia horrida]|uniref:F-box domain-containing protein n=1 Tax=Tilletia horrida TaxID=155126 RepID=A0AAN6GR12_9BASI|nr:hypothetical protein OC846_002662 [Tilletia horrida]KAK0569716.1 hypothetical protein OC861_000678 [Tilletia horrida]